MGVQWARCRICNEKFYVSYSPRFDSGREILQVMLRHFRAQHREHLDEFLEEFPEMRELNAWLEQHNDCL